MLNVAAHFIYFVVFPHPERVRKDLPDIILFLVFNLLYIKNYVSFYQNKVMKPG